MGEINDEVDEMNSGNSDANSGIGESNAASRRENIVMVMITIDRSSSGRENYLYETAGNLVRSNALFLHQQLFPSRVNDAHFREGDWSVGAHGLTPADRDYLPCENAGRALVGGAEIATRLGVDWVLFCEDDLDFCDEFSSSVAVWLDEHAHDDYRVYSFGCAYPNVELLSRPGASMIVNGAVVTNPTYWRYPCTKFYGTQCFAIRRDDARSLGSYLFSNPDVRGVKSPGAYDLMFHDWMAREYPNNYFFLASVPSFVQHIGRQSVCTGLEATHVFSSWKGLEWRYRAKPKEKYGRLDALESFRLGYVPAKVFVDGNEVDGCTVFDDIEGWADLNLVDETGHYYADDTGRVASKRVYGKVEYRPHSTSEVSK